MKLYRICRTSLSKTPLDGEGSFLYGGRWSNPGTRMAYTSTSPSLAALEFLGHRLDRDDIGEPLTLVIADVPDDLVVDTLRRLPRGWRALLPPASTKKVGDTWIRKGKSCLLVAPSLHLPATPQIVERNVLVNPRHRDFARIGIKRIPFVFDARVV